MSDLSSHKIISLNFKYSYKNEYSFGDEVHILTFKKSKNKLEYLPHDRMHIVNVECNNYKD